MKLTNRVKLWWSRKGVRRAVFIFIIAVILIRLTTGDDALQEDTIESLSVVELTTPREYSADESVSLIGTARAFTEADITSERSGRVTTVNVSLGQSVSAGTIIATLENAAEQAAVLQAEGAYEAALAASAQSTVGVAAAENDLQVARNGAVSTFRSAFNTTNGVIVNSIDQYFSNPTGIVPGLGLPGLGRSQFFNSERVAFQSILVDWQGKSSTISTDSNLIAELQYAIDQVNRAQLFVEAFLDLTVQLERNNDLSDDEIRNLSTTFTGLRADLISVRSQLDAALTNLTSAEEDLTRAEIAASGNQVSAADAQVKQALGSLRSAQASLAKTILRTPISGTINSVSVRTGDFVGAFDQVAKVANNGALEIVAFVSDDELALLAVGDDVEIDSAEIGQIIQIAPAVDPVTRKTEIRIATEGTSVQNGDTVRIERHIDTSAVQLEVIQVPLTAVKFNREDGSIFKVEDGLLVQQPVTVGPVFGNGVTIESGLSADDQFVLDVRGLVPGEAVEIAE